MGLNITRKEGQSVTIRTPEGKVIKVSVVRCRSAQQAILRFEASPVDFAVFRSEIEEEQGRKYVHAATRKLQTETQET